MSPMAELEHYVAYAAMLIFVWWGVSLYSEGLATLRTYLAAFFDGLIGG